MSYQWIKQERDAEGVESGAGKGVDPKVASASGTAEVFGDTKSASTPVQGDGSAHNRAAPSTVRYATVERVGKDEAEAKNALQVEVNRQKGRASDKCRQDHENFGQCLATKLSVKSSVLNSLSFSARAQLERALTDECQIQLGTCLTVNSTEPACRERITAEPPASAPQSGAPEGAKVSEAAPPAKEAPAAAKGKQSKKK